MNTDVSTIERFFAKVNLGPVPDGCDLWTGALNAFGYAHFLAENRKTALGHRWLYEFVKGPIPSGYELDHLCRTRRCVRLDHLELVTHRENVLRGRSPSALAAEKTHCKNGHPLSGDNLRKRGSQRVCRTCKLAAWHRWNAKRQAARSALKAGAS